jgi:uncharacterized membrane protein
MRTRQEIKAHAKEAMGAQRGTAILVAFMVGVITFASSALDQIVMFATGMGALYWLVYWVGMAIIFVAGVNSLGEYIKIWNGETASAGAVFTEMGTNFFRKLGGTLWMMLFIILWSLLFIIPGIIKAFSYFFTQNILADCPNVTATQALKISMKITKGYKGEIFMFVLSFIGWWILSMFTLGILAIVYVNPYFYTADAGLYTELKKQALEDGVITYEELGEEPPASEPAPLFQ